MKVVITGICGFVGSELAKSLRAHYGADRLEIVGVDNLSRAGSETNRRKLLRMGAGVVHGDVRSASDLEVLGDADWVIDAAANPSVLAGIDGRASSRQVVEHNLVGTVNLLEYCRSRGAGFVLLSTSRVYSIPALAGLPLEVEDEAFVLKEPTAGGGAGPGGVKDSFSTAAPISLYGATKLASEQLALEYHHTFGMPVWVNRCGVLAGAGQFGHPEQGIFSYWIHAHAAGRPLRYIGFGGSGHQVRDCLHPRDLARLVLGQMEAPKDDPRPRITHASGGADNSMSLAQLTRWCDRRFRPHPVEADLSPRRFDVPWLVLDRSRAEEEWQWRPEIRLEEVLEEIAQHAKRNPSWLELSIPGA